MSCTFKIIFFYKTSTLTIFKFVCYNNIWQKKIKREMAVIYWDDHTFLVWKTIFVSLILRNNSLKMSRKYKEVGNFRMGTENTPSLFSCF